LACLFRRVSTNNILAWIIVFGNSTSALLTGPLLLFILGADRAPKWQQLGWLALVLAQGTLMVLGALTGLSGLRWGPLLMLAVAALNWTLWTIYRQRSSRGNSNQNQESEA